MIINKSYLLSISHFSVNKQKKILSCLICENESEQFQSLLHIEIAKPQNLINYFGDPAKNRA